MGERRISTFWVSLIIEIFLGALIFYVIYRLKKIDHVQPSSITKTDLMECYEKYISIQDKVCSLTNKPVILETKLEPLPAIAEVPITVGISVPVSEPIPDKILSEVEVALKAIENADKEEKSADSSDRETIDNE